MDYQVFDSVSNNGVVYDLDPLPVKSLTPEEVTERKNWEVAVTAIEQHYNTVAQAQILDTDTLLEQRLVAPVLGYEADEVSERSEIAEARSGRAYPPSLQEWDGFADAVNQFRPPNVRIPPRLDFFHMEPR